MARREVTKERVVPILHSMDPAVIAALEQYPLPPTPPSIFAERIWLSSNAQELERRTKQLIASYEQYLEVWFRGLDRAINPALFRGLSIFPDAVPLLERHIEEIEERARERGEGIRRLQKRGKVDVKRAFANDPSIGAVLRTTINDLVRLEETTVERLLDFALWLRAIKSMIDPDARGGALFDSSDDLTKYLARETA